MVADVLVEITNKKLDQTFTYNIPNIFLNDIKVGIRVLVPFNNRKLEGFVIKLHEKDNDMPLKDIIELKDSEPVLNMELLKLGEYISKKTMSTLCSAYQTMLPKALKAKNNYNLNKKYDKYIKLIDKDYIGKNDNQNKILSLLRIGDVIKRDIASSSLNTLIKNNIVEEYTKEVYRFHKDIKKEKCKIVLNEEQSCAVNTVIDSLNTFKPFLLYGVTGSGKTEVYMHIIDKVIMSGKEVIVLVPEISLTPQLIELFKKRFGDLVAVLHSKLSDGERYDEYRKIKNNEVKIVVGARSAIFAPFTNLGLIIIDEEHTSTYKQENNPRYNAIDVALYRCKNYNIPLLLGSATPLIESYTRAKKGIYTLITLKERINKSLPTVSLVDMKDEIKKGNKVISEELDKEIIKALDNDEQIIILLNRRGYATIITCHECGYTFKCPNCDIPLTYHKKSNKLKCHYCNFETYKLDTCPKCKSKDINEFGMGTEKLESILNSKYKARIVRMDIDTTSRKDSVERIVTDFKNHNYDILLGTQMIAKGLDFPNVTLVGVINGDASLNIPDFRSSERTFELLNQVAGRAGRSLKKGKVVIQGFNMDHYSITCASNHDYITFYNKEMKIREELKYPPFYNLTLIKIISEDYELLLTESKKISTYLKRELKDTIILGPTFSNMYKINKKFNMNIILKYKNTKEIINQLNYVNKHYISNKISVEIDINPLKL